MEGIFSDYIKGDFNKALASYHLAEKHYILAQSKRGLASHQTAFYVASRSLDGASICDLTVSISFGLMPVTGRKPSELKSKSYSAKTDRGIALLLFKDRTIRR